MRGHTITELVTLVTETCCSCNVVFAMTDEMTKRLRQSHDTFYCPAGHGQRYLGKSDVEKERERADRAETQLRYARSRAQHLGDQLQATSRSLSATKGVLTKTRKRIGNGACPCCNRHFVDVERHMANKHPDYKEQT